ncbi:MAG TPA: hypothetical protein VFT53_05005 [Candidatus Saccharimonadales bacterium]|nr:hypothetical protein [Candidatus Saccharimonadales bacterium]
MHNPADGGSTHDVAVVTLEDYGQLVLAELRVGSPQMPNSIDDWQRGERLPYCFRASGTIYEATRAKLVMALLPLEETTLGEAETPASQSGIRTVTAVVIHP